jgi:hydrogenase maturation protease
LLKDNNKKVDTNKRVLIFGIGNPLYRDDGTGNKIIETLEVKYSFPDSGRLIEAGSLTDLIDFMNDYDFVIVIDTILMGKRPGEIVTFSLDEMTLPLNSLSHSTGFFEGLKKMQEKPEIFFICIEPYDLSLGTGLSGKISKKTAYIIKIIIDQLGLFGIKQQNL